jgi:hypothetical protein
MRIGERLEVVKKELGLEKRMVETMGMWPAESTWGGGRARRTFVWGDGRKREEVLVCHLIFLECPLCE